MTEAVEDAAVSDTGLKGVAVVVEIGVDVNEMLMVEVIGAMAMIEFAVVCKIGECSVGTRWSGDMGV